MEIRFPFEITRHGRVAQADEPSHVRQMIEQLLFTAPGERVNRPDFGCGLLELVFAPDSDALVSATQFLVLGSLQRWLGHVIEVQDVSVAADDSALSVTIRYRVKRTGEARQEIFRTPGSVA